MRTTRVLAIIAILGIAFSFRASANVVYDSETTNDWFSVDMSSLTTETLRTPPWTPPSPDGEAVMDGAVIKLDTDLDDPLTYTAEDGSADVAIVAAEMTAAVNASVPDLNTVPQAALCVIGTEAATNWVGLVGTTENGAGYKWVTFSAHVPVAGETYSIRIEFDQRQDQRKIRYRVGDTVLGNGWYPNPKTTDVANIQSVSFSGTGDISGLGGSNVVANAATFNGVGYQTFEAALAAARAQGSGWSAEKPVVLYKNAEHAATVSDVLYVNPNGRTFTINGEVVTKTSGFTYTITAKSECEAYIGSTYYVTFDEAVAAAGANDVIVVNKSLTKDLAITKSLGVDPAGKLNCSALTVGSGFAFNLAGNLSVQTATVNGSVTGEGILTVTGTLTGVNVAKLTFGNAATFAYGDAPIASTTALTLGSLLTITGLETADIGTTVIDNAAVAGATLAKFAATTKEGAELGIVGNQLKVVEAKPDIEIKIAKDTAGYDFTNGTINVNATVKSGTSGTLTLTVVNFDGTVRDQVSKEVSGSGAVAFDLNDLTAGGTYSYMIEVSEGGKDLGTSYGTFTAANWGDVWFGADASLGEGQRVVGGDWAEEPKIENNVYVIEEASVFNVNEKKQEQGSNRVTRVDAKVTFESLVDGEVDVPEEGAISGFVATTDGWKALANDAWVSLTGGPTPVAGMPYVIRAEVDFISATKRVRYLVSEDDGVTFIPLSSETAQWLDLAASTRSLLAKVELQGSGKLAKFEAKVADKAIAEVDDVEYDTMEEALAAAGTEGTNTIKLLTNATVDPKQPGSYDISPNNYHYVSGGKVSTDTTNTKTIVIDPSGKPVVRPSTATMKLVNTPDGAHYKDVNSLRAFLERNGVTEYQNENATAESITTALQAIPKDQDANGLALWQDYALGVDKDTPVAPVTIPTGDTAKDGITLAIPAINPDNYSGDYTISYQINGVEIKEGAPQAILLPLKTDNYEIKAVFTPASEQAK